MQKVIEQLRHKFHTGRSELFSRVAWNAPSKDLLDAHTTLVDELLKDIFDASCRVADRKAVRSAGSGLAIVATGGYGRRELNPYSDIDIAFVPSEEEDPWIEALVHTAFKLVMDVFLSLRDVHVGYSFRPIAEATAWDVKTKTSLLDLRLVCGDEALAEKLARRIREVLSPLELMLELPPRGGCKPKTSQSLYAVEPNLKEGPGALRDLHCARWIFKLLLKMNTSALDPGLKFCAGISDRQIAEVHSAADWFWRARTWLHLAAGRPSDVLITNYQDRIARELNDCSAQDWLSRHMEHAEALERFREAALRTLLRGPLTVHGVRLEEGALHLENDQPNPASAIVILRAAQRYDLPISLKDLSRLEEARKNALEIQEASEEEIWTFTQILGANRAVAGTLRALAAFGVLDRFLPNYSKVMRFVPPDPAHRYTVGEHSMRMVEHLECLRDGQNPREQRFSELLGQCEHFDMLCLAALLHDAGKLGPNTDHCSAGAEIANAVASALNLAPEKREILDVLVRHHLLLVRTARLHDLKSANVIQKAADQMPSLEALRHLYIFTYVDNSAVAENNWTSMDLRDLEDLYKRMQDCLAVRFDDGPGPTGQEEQSALIRKKLAALQAKNETSVLKHCDAMPAGYVLNTPLEEIAFHLELLERLESECVVLDVYNRPGDDYTELTLCTYDDPRPGMLAKIAGVLHFCNVDIHRAQAFTMEKERRVVLDTLWVRSNGTQISENKARRIRATLKEILTGAQTIEHILKMAGKSASGSIVVDAIDLHNNLSEEHTVVHIVAHDLQGLLYLMTRCLSRCGLDIHSAKIATWNGRAENNFYVTATTGGQIPDRDLPSWKYRLAQALRNNLF
ncbi:MAG: HD domain-containing protein [Acidobacteriota bacterium]|nr:HD domain-containing protein [Acidobacteriota bacterium]